MGHRRESQTQASSSVNRQKFSKLKDRNARQGEERRNKGQNGTGEKNDRSWWEGFNNNSQSGVGNLCSFLVYKLLRHTVSGLHRRHLTDRPSKLIPAMPLRGTLHASYTSPPLFLQFTSCRNNAMILPSGSAETVPMGYWQHYTWPVIKYSLRWG